MRRELIILLLLAGMAGGATAGVVRGHRTIVDDPDPMSRPTRVTPVRGPLVIVEGEGGHMLKLHGKRAASYIDYLLMRGEEQGVKDDRFRSVITCALTIQANCSDQGGIGTIVHVTQGNKCSGTCANGSTFYYDDSGDADCNYAPFPLDPGICCHECWPSEWPCSQDCNMDGCADDDPTCCPTWDESCRS